MAVASERTGWRDQKLSERHRDWGWDCPAVDIDFLLIEYDKGEPVAIVEYKHEKAEIPDISHSSYRALISLGDRAGIPVVICTYSDDLKWYRVRPVNEKAEQIFGAPRILSELEWVKLLYRIRNRDIPEMVLSRIGRRSSPTRSGSGGGDEF